MEIFSRLVRATDQFRELHRELDHNKKPVRFIQVLPGNGDDELYAISWRDENDVEFERSFTAWREAHCVFLEQVHGESLRKVLGVALGD